MEENPKPKFIAFTLIFYYIITLMMIITVMINISCSNHDSETKVLQMNQHI